SPMVRIVCVEPSTADTRSNSTVSTAYVDTPPDFVGRSVMVRSTTRGSMQSFCADRTDASALYTSSMPRNLYPCCWLLLALEMPSLAIAAVTALSASYTCFPRSMSRLLPTQHLLQLADNLVALGDLPLRLAQLVLQIDRPLARRVVDRVH